MKRTVVIYALLAGAIIGLLVANYMVEQRWIAASHKNDVQRICNRSRAVRVRSLIDDCINIQNTYNMEYLCQNENLSAMCWVEEK